MTSRGAPFVRYLKYTLGAAVIDVLDRRTRLLDGDLEPPAAINFTGDGEFTTVGDHLVDLLEQRAGLLDGQAVLDIGCGMGRAATALARRYQDLRYDGFVIVRYGISWCTKHLAGRQGFRFVYADVHNEY